MSIVMRAEGKGQSTFDTSDFGQAAALLSTGKVLLSMHPDEDNTKRVVFHFVITPDIEQSAEDYWGGKLLVDAKRYWSESKNLKARLYGGKWW